MKEITDKDLQFMLAANGFIFPTTDAEMDAFEEVHKDYVYKNLLGSITAEKILAMPKPKTKPDESH